MTANTPILFDCYLDPALEASHPELLAELRKNLTDWKVPFEMGSLLASTNDHIFICTADSWSTGVSKKETFVLIPSEKGKEAGPLNKKVFWLEGENRFLHLHQFLLTANDVILKKRHKEIKSKLELTLELLKQGSEVKSSSALISESSQIKKSLEDILNKKLKVKKYDFVKTDDLYLRKHEEYDYILPLWDEQEFLVFSGKIKDVALLTQVMKEAWIEHENREQKLAGDEAVLEEAYKKLTLPMALINESGDILLHNAAFVKLSLTPDQCLSYSDGAKILLVQGAYKVIKKLVGVDTELYFFAFQAGAELANKSGTNANSEELGIISSSIAHELNNPLAGIMAAIGLLSLDDNWSADARMDLEEMKRGSARCKVLVETFLGFSRMNPQHTVKGSYEQGLEQALNLIRFRLVESNMKLAFKKELSGSQTQINNSIFSMVLYLIFGELITAFAHHMLVAKQAEAQKMIEGKVFTEKISGKEALVIRVITQFDFEETIRKSKLIKHLLELENHSMQVENHQIMIL